MSIRENPGGEERWVSSRSKARCSRERTSWMHTMSKSSERWRISRSQRGIPEGVRGRGFLDRKGSVPEGVRGGGVLGGDTELIFPVSLKSCSKDC
jgi:hypothetical protein